MKRTTISLPDDLAASVEREAHRRRVPVSQIAREALEEKLGHTGGARRFIPFAALGRSGFHSTARDIEVILEREWTASDGWGPAVRGGPAASRAAGGDAAPAEQTSDRDR